MDRLVHTLADLILAIEAEMRRVGLWQQEAPPKEALASLMPFHYDTLRLEQWIQWVMLPQMKAILEQEQSLPTTSEIFPLAEYSFAERREELARLLDLIASFDRLINDQGLQREPH